MRGGEGKEGGRSQIEKEVELNFPFPPCVSLHDHQLLKSIFIPSAHWHTSMESTSATSKIHAASLTANPSPSPSTKHELASLLLLSHLSPPLHPWNPIQAYHSSQSSSSHPRHYRSPLVAFGRQLERSVSSSSSASPSSRSPPSTVGPSSRPSPWVCLVFSVVQTLLRTFLSLSIPTAVFNSRGAGETTLRSSWNGRGEMHDYGVVATEARKIAWGERTEADEDGAGEVYYCVSLKDLYLSLAEEKGSGQLEFGFASLTLTFPLSLPLQGYSYGSMLALSQPPLLSPLRTFYLAISPVSPSSFFPPFPSLSSLDVDVDSPSSSHPLLLLSPVPNLQLLPLPLSPCPSTHHPIFSLPKPILTLDQRAEETPGSSRRERQLLLSLVGEEVG